jgi:hypothetical protein
VEFPGATPTHLRRASRKVREGITELRAAMRELEQLDTHVVVDEEDVRRLADDLTTTVRDRGPLLITTTRAPLAGAEEAAP